VDFDHLTVTLLILRPDAPKLDEEAANALQDAHMSHLADLHEAGQLLAAGPLSDEKFRGLSIMRVDPERRASAEGAGSGRSGRALLGQGHPLDGPGGRDDVLAHAVSAVSHRGHVGAGIANSKRGAILLSRAKDSVVCQIASISPAIVSVSRWTSATALSCIASTTTKAALVWSRTAE
jgi:hypothetical protein